MELCSVEQKPGRPKVDGNVAMSTKLWSSFEVKRCKIEVTISRKALNQKEWRISGQKSTVFSLRGNTASVNVVR